MSPAAELTAAGQRGNHHLGRTARLEIAALVRKPHHRIGVGDVQPTRRSVHGIKSNAERPIQSGGKHRHRLGPALVAAAAQYPQVARLAFHNEDIAIRSRTNQARRRQLCRV